MPQSTLLNLPAADDTAQQFLEDIELGCLVNGIAVPPTGKGTHFGLTGQGAGNIASILVANQQLIDNDINPLTAEEPALDGIRDSDGLPIKPPVRARLELQVTVQGLVTIPAGLAWQGPGGVRGTIDSPKSGTSGTITCQTTVTDAGSAGNLPSGTFVNLISAPLNVQNQAKVTLILSLGSDVEQQEDKRNRIMTARRNPPGGGNWSQLAEVALASETNADGAWVYCALGRPGATKVILTRTNASTPQDRTVDTSGIDAVINAFAKAFPVEAQNLVVDTVVNEDTYVWYKTSLSTTSGAYWSDGTRAWPEYPMQADIVTGSTYTLTALAGGNSTALTAGQTRQVAAWSNALNSFINLTVTFVSGTYPGPYTVTVSGTASIDQMSVCPWAPNLNAYAAEMLTIFGTMGPGEYLSSGHARYRRAHRRPEPASQGPSVLNAVQSGQLQAAFPAEILQLLQVPLATITPSLPANVAGKPNILVPVNFQMFPGI